ncbi:MULTISPECIES: class Ia ribonucleoside-diphosphate reductase subunit beta [Alteromonas]|uniref:ribonucleoside-diphosphate reductase n=1 Tax=Alteromonas macleodii TaxID=28108 RepID=A0A126Q2J9_ALTMA|nr:MULTISPECIES: class Ia ribonucleoside-diphosphate reductase subunit beta [Alteromonas]AMJ98658.1 ribonucleotide-diphosphate reductase subunit beta [Alteromonas macleodii]MCG7649936.1 ribonucleotide-diphosphate reductase subunit beta [Alteromonas sp. MmMcT2-5]|tara:strand:+ start:251 stop:1381 length:1131 start_codon:yes stop_codon:yes gene_type:complete
MAYQTFRKESNDPLSEPIFFGNSVNVSRFDQQKHSIFERLTEKQISFFWRPEEVDLSRDRIDFNKMTDSEKHIFTSNLKYQTLLDSVQGRSPSIALLPICSLSEFELWVDSWVFFESIHSRSYTHIMRNVFNDPSPVFDDITQNPNIIKRAVDVSKYYDDLIFATQLWQTLGEGVHKVNGVSHNITVRELKKKLFLCMQSVNALEAIRFYVSFACTFAFSERKMCEGSGKILRLIARDENLHLTSTQHVINLWRSGRDDPEMKEIAEELHDEARNIFLSAVEQEKEWADYLFKDGSMIGLNAQILKSYVEYIANQRMSVIGFDQPFDVLSNPLPWMNNYLSSDNVQVAPQESEISSYLVGQISAEVNSEDFEDFEL